MKQSNNQLDEALKNDILTLLEIPAARRFFLKLFCQTHLLELSYSLDQSAAAYNEGLRTVGVWLKLVLETSRPGEFARLLLEEVNNGGNNGGSDDAERREDS